MRTKFKSAAEAAANLVEDPKVEKQVEEEIACNSLVGMLLEIRVEKGITQEKIAEAMGCDPSVVSRIESGNDRQLKWSDVLGYCSALNIEMNILFNDPSLPAASRIKQYVFKIHEDLESLAKLCEQVGGEDEIAREIDRFYRKVLFNFITGFKKNHEMVTSILRVPAKLPCPPNESKQHRAIKPAETSELKPA